MLIDTHAHLQMKDFKSDLDNVLRRAKDAGVDYIINSSFDIPSSQDAVKLAEKYDNLYASVGIHPHDAKALDDKAYQVLQELAKHPKVIAIGEIGLDYYRDLSPRSLQKEAFEKQMALAHEVGLPIIIHNRDSHEDMLTILRQNLNGLGGVMHCFSGDQDFADACLALGLYISFAGPVTYPNAPILRKIASDIQSDRFFVETDCPYLAPQIMRGKRNEPAYVKAVAQKIAEVRRTTLPEIGKISTDNAKRLFRLC
ncbi:TPA: TatD family deoxyribonuclease [bacterium]|nr:TatD family deoxyribonuclease [bacterium]